MNNKAIHNFLWGADNEMPGLIPWVALTGPIILSLWLLSQN